VSRPAVAATHELAEAAWQTREAAVTPAVTLLAVTLSVTCPLGSPRLRDIMGMEFGGSRALDAPPRRPPDLPSELPAFRLPPRAPGWERLQLVDSESGRDVPAAEAALLGQVLTTEAQALAGFPDAQALLLKTAERQRTTGSWGRELFQAMDLLRGVATAEAGSLHGAEAELAHGRLADVFAFVWDKRAPEARRSGEAWMRSADRTAAEAGRRMGSRDILARASQVGQAARHELTQSLAHRQRAAADPGLNGW
jgi:hypothetical protein